MKKMLNINLMLEWCHWLSYTHSIIVSFYLLNNFTGYCNNSVVLIKKNYNGKQFSYIYSMKTVFWAT